MVAKELADSPGRAGMPGPACPADADKGRSIATREAVRVRARPTSGAGPDPADANSVQQRPDDYLLATAAGRRSLPLSIFAES